MKKSILSRYHVNEVPFAIKPIFYLYGYGISFLVFIYFVVVHLTSKIKIIGKENLKEDANYIICFWHSFIFLYFTVFLKNYRHAWMQHATWYMKTSHVMLRYVGVRKIILGSTGHAGKEAANQLVGYLKDGYSTVLLPDGPNGPPFQMKKGAFHISMQSNVPILPVRFYSFPSIKAKSWDRRKCPLPFSTITVEYGKPTQVTSSNFEAAYDSISIFLNEKATKYPAEWGCKKD
jgi:lysophospholipid acyltransferase (LPLAT)-like uncharacterized protein